MKQKKVRIVLLNWNNKKLTEQCASSILNFLDLNSELVIVDNDSSDGSNVYLHKKLPCTILQSGYNRGWAGGNNMGIAYQSAFKPDAYLLLNNDVEMDKKVYDILVKFLFSRKDIGISGPKTYFSSRYKVIADAGGIIDKNRFFGQNRGSNEYDKGQYDRVTQVDYITGACMLIKQEVFEEVGLFDEDYFLYYEDADFCERAKRKGYYSFYTPDATVIHAVSTTIKNGSPLHNYFTTRNHLIFVEKHAPIQVKIKEIARLPKTIYEFAREKDIAKQKYSLLGIRDYLLRRFGKQWYW